jgi:hypothetical protein
VQPRIDAVASSHWDQYITRLVADAPGRWCLQLPPLCPAHHFCALHCKLQRSVSLTPCALHTAVA